MLGAIKARVVSADEREAGMRELLNFGHTFGHAIEAGLGFGTWLHGEAVGCGMVLGAKASLPSGPRFRRAGTKIERLIASAGLPVVRPAMPTDRWLELMRHDKKARGGTIRLVLPDGPGSGRTASGGRSPHPVGDRIDGIRALKVAARRNQPIHGVAMTDRACLLVARCVFVGGSCQCPAGRSPRRPVD